MTEETTGSSREIAVDALIIGAGFAGLYMLHKLRGLGLAAKVIETGSDVGGTWYWNRYPGARCDVDTALYSYGFDEALQQEWQWSEHYATQPELLRYLRHVADRFDLRRDMWFNTRVTAAHYNEDRGNWTLSTDRGDRVDARWCILATGNLSIGRIPEIAGLNATSLPVYHTGNWPHEGVDFTGLDVALLGTGSSGIQAVPEIAKVAKHLTVYQRTPSFTVPANNRPRDPAEFAKLKEQYPELRKCWRAGEIYGAGEPLEPGMRFRRDVPLAEASEEERRAEFQQRWDRGGGHFNGAFADILTNEEANEAAAEFVRGKIREIVQDPDIAEKLSPRGIPIGAKRLAVDDGYYATFNRANVTLVDLHDEPIAEVTRHGIRTAKDERRHDALVFATGFDAMTGAIMKIDITGRDGAKLADKWNAGPRTYLGLMSHGFPNLLFVTGPGSPSVLGNVVCHIEQHVEFIADLLADTLNRGEKVIEAEPAAENAWVERVNTQAEQTLYPRANSWFLGANVPGKPRVFMPFVGGIGLYREICDAIAAEGYKGFDRGRLTREA